MHGIHHSIREEEVDANYSSLLSVWDRLHRSLKLNVRQKSITIGVAGFLDAEDVTLVESLTLPFRDDARLQLAGEPPAEIGRQG
jgi:sterol desaturase/sphingolipid hydroxylase (fatty acid hydroxylase superfamily)